MAGKSDEVGRVTVLRFNPDTDQPPGYVTYDGVPYKQMRVLDVLQYIYQNLDPTLAFRYSCRNALCDVCSIKVNGKTVLACLKLADKEMVIEPAEPFVVLRDVATEFGKRKKAP